ncbi:MAG: hypothetical protein KAR20_08735 [Candidatus Heimdallarchaeota archaeon]|nr:hypothetical protein [Candidatus Heimdallarchaeota archaeon]
MTEYSLHFDIKDWYSVSGDELEVKVDGFIIDILRDKLLIEIQTRNFSAIKKKLIKLLLNNQVRLVYPIAKLKWIVHVSKSGEFVRRRKSPKKGKLIDLFYELVHMSYLVRDNNFSLEVLLIEEEELRCNDGKGSWKRRGASIKDRKLLNVFNRIVFENRRDFLRFLPNDMVEPFTNKLLAMKLGISIKLAQKITYCLRKMDVISIAGKKRKELLFKVS